MRTKNHTVILPSLVSSVLLGAMTAIIAFRSDLWLPFGLIGLSVGALGLYVSNRQARDDESLAKDRWRVAMNSFLASMAVYLVSIIIMATNAGTNLLAAGLIFMGIVILPFTFGAASMLAIVLLPSKR